MNKELDRPNVAPEGTIWVCSACGKTSPTRAPERDTFSGWDVSCMLNAVLCHNDISLVKEDGRVISAKPVEVNE